MVIWKPDGELNIAAAATDLPEQSDGSTISSGAVTRCKNLTLVRRGMARMRRGSTNIHELSGAGQPTLNMSQGGTIYTFSGDSIYRNGESIVSGLNDGQWSGILYNQFNDTEQQIFALNGTDRKRIVGSDVYGWGIEAPTDAPTLASGGDTGLTGSYNAKYTYARIVGDTVVSESNPSPAAASAQSITDDELRITWTASDDPQVTHVRIYRTLSTGTSNYFHDQDVEIGTTTLDTSTADADLGTVVAENHDRPPAGAVVAGPFYNGTCFIGIGNLLYWCLAKQPEYWPALNFVEVGPPHHAIRSITVMDGNVYVGTTERLWLIQGTAAGTFNPIPIESLAGSPSVFGAVGIKGVGVYHIGNDGLYLFSGGRDQKTTQENFEPIFAGDDTNGMPAVTDANRFLFQYGNKLYFHYGNGAVLRINLDTGRSEYHQYDAALSAPCNDISNNRMIVGTGNNEVRWLENSDATDDAGTDFDWEVQSKDFLLQTRAHFPRWVKYDVDGTATGSLLLDGEVHQEHALTASRNTRRRLVKTGNGNLAAIRIDGSSADGAAVIYAVEFE